MHGMGETGSKASGAGIRGGVMGFTGCVCVLEEKKSLPAGGTRRAFGIPEPGQSLENRLSFPIR